MAQGIPKRICKKNVVSYRVQIRESDGFPTKSKTFSTLQEAKDWQKQEKAHRRVYLKNVKTAEMNIYSLL